MARQWFFTSPPRVDLGEALEGIGFHPRREPRAHRREPVLVVELGGRDFELHLFDEGLACTSAMETLYALGERTENDLTLPNDVLPRVTGIAYLDDAGGDESPPEPAVVRHQASKLLRGLAVALGAVAYVDGDRLCAPDGSVLGTFDATRHWETDQEPPRPSPRRVLQRARVLACMTIRAQLDGEQLKGAPPNARADMRRWLEDTGAWHEAEPDERAFLARGDDEPASERSSIDSTWRAEGLAVLGWALGLAPLPPHDVAIETWDVLRPLGFLKDTPATLERPVLLPLETLDWQARRLLGLHWRFRELSLQGQPMDYARFAGQCWFGSFDLEGIALAGGDLAVGGRPIAEADPGHVRFAQSIAMERHRAINWLLGYHRVYSGVDTST